MPKPIPPSVFAPPSPVVDVTNEPHPFSGSTILMPPAPNSSTFKMDARGNEAANDNVCDYLKFKAKVANAYGAAFMRWTTDDILNGARYHQVLCLFALGLLFFMAVEYTLLMVPNNSPPHDIGFILTRKLHRLLSSLPELNTLLAALNTVFVGMQTAYILWAWLIEGRARATISALFMFTCRGILGYSTQLPLPQEFLGSGMDFPVGNVSFFLFFSGHVAGAVIASLDMRRMRRWELAWTFDVLNVLQAVRLLGTRGHYTIDLAVGFGAGLGFDSLAGKYQDSRKLKGYGSRSM